MGQGGCLGQGDLLRRQVWEALPESCSQGQGGTGHTCLGESLEEQGLVDLLFEEGCGTQALGELLGKVRWGGDRHKELLLGKGGSNMGREMLGRRMSVPRP